MCRVPYLDVTAVDVHAADHAALRGYVGPVDHLLGVMIVQSHGVVQTLFHTDTPE